MDMAHAENVEAVYEPHEEETQEAEEHRAEEIIHGIIGAIAPGIRWGGGGEAEEPSIQTRPGVAAGDLRAVLRQSAGSPL